MRRLTPRFLIICLCLAMLGCTAVVAQENPRAGQRDRGAAPEAEMTPDELHARAILEIKSEAGTCYWRVSGDDDLVRLPVEDERFPTLLLSAKFEDDQLQITMAGEREPLSTTSLGQVDLSLQDGAPVAVDTFRAVKNGTRGWQLRALRPTAKIDTSNCCKCGIVKLSCCPNTNYCMGCGACGTCCN